MCVWDNDPVGDARHCIRHWRIIKHFVHRDDKWADCLEPRTRMAASPTVGAPAHPTAGQADGGGEPDEGDSWDRRRGGGRDAAAQLPLVAWRAWNAAAGWPSDEASPGQWPSLVPMSTTAAAVRKSRWLPRQAPRNPPQPTR